MKENEIDKNTSDDYTKFPLTEPARQENTRNLIGSWFLLLALAVFANRFTNGDFQLVAESMVAIGLVSFFFNR